MSPILDVIEAANWTALVNRLLRTAMTPQQVAEMPEEAVWVLGAMWDEATKGSNG